MLTDVGRKAEYSDVIAWGPQGSGFIISKPKTFTTTLLPKYFRTSKFSSFQRQLNAYGFVRGNLYAGQEDMYIYSHPVFHRDHAESVNIIKRRNTPPRPRRIAPSKTVPNARVPVSVQSSGPVPPRYVSMAHAFSDFNSSLADYDMGILGLLRQLSGGVGYAASEGSSEATEDIWRRDPVVLDEDVASLDPSCSTDTIS